MRYKKPSNSSDLTSKIDDLDYADNFNDDHHDGQPRSSVMHDTAANDLFNSNFDLDLSFVPPDDPKSRLNINFSRKLVWSGVVLLLIICVFLFAYFYPFSTHSNNPSVLDVKTKSVNKVTVSSVLATELEVLGNDIILSRRWRAPDLNEFGKLWDQLDRKSQKSVLDSIWFQHFSFNLKRQAGGLFGIASENEASKSLANKLGLELNTAKIIRRVDIDSTVEQESQIVGVATESSSVSSDQQTPTVETIVTSKPADNSNKQELSPTNQVASNVTSSVSEKISDSELKQVLHQYSKSYIFGNISDFDELFLNYADTQQQSVIDDQKKEFANLLKNSVQRWVEFRDLKWVHDKEIAIGTGQILLEATAQNNSRKITNANILIKLRRVNDQLKIAGFNLSNQTVSVKAIDAAKMQASSDVASETSNQPSLIELQKVVSRYIEAYEKGNIEMLDKLFSTDIISNKGTTRAEIRQDYVDLFAVSGNRQMTIRNLRWKLAKQHAKGIGVMKVVVEKENAVKVINGKIQFVTKKIGNEVLITHLYRLESAQ